MTSDSRAAHRHLLGAAAVPAAPRALPRRSPSLSGLVPRGAAWPLAALLLCGCTAGPTLDVLGSFFPAWLLCAALGIVAALLARLLLALAGLGSALLVPPLTYFGVAVAATLALWLLWLGR